MQKYRLAVCEDDSIVREGVRRFCEETLTKENISYEIAEFSSGEELEKALKTKPESFNLLILDIMLETGRRDLNYTYSYFRFIIELQACQREVDSLSFVFVQGDMGTLFQPSENKG